MTAQWLKAQTSADGKTLTLACWVDVSRQTPDGMPDPAFVETFTYGLDAKFTAERALEEAKGLIEQKWAPPPEPVPLSDHGKEWSFKGDERRASDLAGPEPVAVARPEAKDAAPEAAKAEEPLSASVEPITIDRLVLTTNKDVLVIGYRQGAHVAAIVASAVWEATLKEDRKDLCLATLSTAPTYEEPVLEEITL